jgi:hypothetical protein
MRAKTINEDQKERKKQSVLVTGFENQIHMLIKKYIQKGLPVEIAKEITEEIFIEMEAENEEQANKDYIEFRRQTGFNTVGKPLSDL